jgi:hypothetical protein
MSPQVNIPSFKEIVAKTPKPVQAAIYTTLSLVLLAVTVQYFGVVEWIRELAKPKQMVQISAQQKAQFEEYAWHFQEGESCNDDNDLDEHEGDQVCHLMSDDCLFVERKRAGRVVHRFIADPARLATDEPRVEMPQIGWIFDVEAKRAGVVPAGGPYCPQGDCYDKVCDHPLFWQGGFSWQVEATNPNNHCEHRLRITFVNVNGQLEGCAGWIWMNECTGSWYCNGTGVYKPGWYCCNH